MSLKGSVLLVHPSGKYNKHAKWYPVKETIEKGETHLQAAMRAVIEELGLSIDKVWNIHPLGIVEYNSRKKRVICYTAVFLGKHEDIKLDWENDRWDWYLPHIAEEVVQQEYTSIMPELTRRLRCLYESTIAGIPPKTIMGVS